jgi:hypothetical protein
MPRSVKSARRYKRLSIDFELLDWRKLKADAKRKSREGGTPVKPTHLVRLAIKRYLDSAA